MEETTSVTRIAAVILAAGMSKRMGSPKALLDLDGRPLIGRLVDTARSVSEIGKIVVVTGHEPEQIRQAIGEHPSIEFVHNDDFETGGMFSSIKVGTKALIDQCEAFFVMLLDQPLVKAETLAAMAQNWLLSRPRPAVVVPSYRGKRGHPVLIDGHFVQMVAFMPESSTLRDFMMDHRPQSAAIEVVDPGVLTDLNTPQDYQQLLNLWRTK